MYWRTQNHWCRLAVGLTGYVFFGSSVIISERVRELARFVGEPSSSEATTAPSKQNDESSLKAIRLDRVPSALKLAKRFVLLDFKHVTGIDATAAALFKTLFISLSQRRITLVLTGIVRPSQVYWLLQGNGVVAPDRNWEAGSYCPYFETMGHALSWCEQHFLQVRSRAVCYST